MISGSRAKMYAHAITMCYQEWGEDIRPVSNWLSIAWVRLREDHPDDLKHVLREMEYLLAQVGIFGINRRAYTRMLYDIDKGVEQNAIH